MKFNGNRYVTKLPFKPYKGTLPDNYYVSKNRLFSFKNKLEKNPKLRDDYAEVIENYIKEGIVEKVNDVESYNTPGDVHYLPHRAVVKDEKTSTKVRMVCDGSARSRNQASLNDVLYSGPCPLLYDIILRFRIGEKSYNKGRRQGPECKTSFNEA